MEFIVTSRALVRTDTISVLIIDKIGSVDITVAARAATAHYQHSTRSVKEGYAFCKAALAATNERFIELAHEGKITFVKASLITSVSIKKADLSGAVLAYWVDTPAASFAVYEYMTKPSHQVRGHERDDYLNMLKQAECHINGRAIPLDWYND